MAPDADCAQGLHPGSSGNEAAISVPMAVPNGLYAHGAIRRAVSDVSAEVGRESKAKAHHPTSEAAEEQAAQCECCGLREEYTRRYICKVRERFCGRWICGLCAEAVNEERHRMGRATPVEDALRAHMALCLRFNSLARTNPTLYMADAMRQLLRKSSSSRGLRSNPGSPTRRDSKGAIVRSSSCIPALTRDRSSRTSRP